MYDCIVVGCGAGGFAAGIYLKRYTVNCINICKDVGGDASKAFVIENYPGFKSITGIEWSMRVKEHLESLDGKIIIGEVIKVTKKNNSFEVETSQGKKYQAKTVILAGGMKRRKLQIPGALEFEKKGISYCVTCDGPLYKGKDVAIVGGGNAGVSAAIMMSDLASKVYIIEIEEKLLAEDIRIKHLEERKNIEQLLGRKIVKVEGKNQLEKIILDKPFRGKNKIEVSGLFVEIGSMTEREIPKMLGIKLDNNGLIEVNQDQSTNIEGLWAAGDATTGSNKFRQLVTAQAEGAVAANSVYKFLNK